MIIWVCRSFIADREYPRTLKRAIGSVARFRFGGAMSGCRCASGQKHAQALRNIGSHRKPEAGLIAGLQSADDLEVIV